MEIDEHITKIGLTVSYPLASNNNFQNDNRNLCHVGYTINDFHPYNRNTTSPSACNRYLHRDNIKMYTDIIEKYAYTH